MSSLAPHLQAALDQVNAAAQECLSLGLADVLDMLDAGHRPDIIAATVASAVVGSDIDREQLALGYAWALVRLATNESRP